MVDDASTSLYGRMVATSGYGTLSPATVQEKLGLTQRTDYVRYAIEAGILGS